ncbi:MAG: hypothetical protein MI919_37720, partial [Holophagales bacterium]|nr:hypothetical protein [Holophagales bacterium]
MKNKLSTWIPGTLGVLSILLITGSFNVDTADAGTCWDCVTWEGGGLIYDSICCEDGNYNAQCNAWLLNGGYVSHN